MALFVYSILSKWYITIAITGIVVAFWVFKGLSDSGVLKKAEDVVFGAFGEAKSVARYCVPKITNLEDFWNCLQNPPKYEPTAHEQELGKLYQDNIDPDIYDPRQDPYYSE